MYVPKSLIVGKMCHGEIAGLVRSINVVSSPAEEILEVSGLERDLRSSVTEDDKKSGQE